jgi:hypothetical protein
MEGFFMGIDSQDIGESFEKNIPECGLVKAKDNGGRGRSAHVVTD